MFKITKFEKFEFYVFGAITFDLCLLVFIK